MFQVRLHQRQLARLLQQLQLQQLLHQLKVLYSCKVSHLRYKAQRDTAATGMPNMNPFAALLSQPPVGNTQTPAAGANPMAAMMPMMMQMMAQNPALLESLVANDPNLRNMGIQPSQITSMLSNPAFMQILSDPNLLNSMMQNNPMLNAAIPQNPMLQNPMLASMFGGMPNANPTAAAPASNLPPQERFASQLQQLQDMGFFDQASNIQALTVTNGNVNAAVEYLLSRPF